MYAAISLAFVILVTEVRYNLSVVWIYIFLIPENVEFFKISSLAIYFLFLENWLDFAPFNFFIYFISSLRTPYPIFWSYSRPDLPFRVSPLRQHISTTSNVLSSDSAWCCLYSSEWEVIHWLGNVLFFFLIDKFSPCGPSWHQRLSPPDFNSWVLGSEAWHCLYV